MSENELLEEPVVFLAERRGTMIKGHTVILRHPVTHMVDDHVVHKAGLRAVFGSQTPGGLPTYKTNVREEVELLNKKVEQGFIQGIRIVNLSQMREGIKEKPAGIEQINGLLRSGNAKELDVVAKELKGCTFTDALRSLTRGEAEQMAGMLAGLKGAVAEDEQLNTKKVEKEKSLRNNPKVGRSTKVAE